MKKYFIHNGNDEQGPYSIDDLKSLGIYSNTMIWFEGIQTWTKAAYIPELKEIIIASPPPFEKAKKIMDKDYVDEIENKIPNNIGRRVFKYSLIILAILGIYFIFQNVRPRQISNETKNVLNYLMLKDAQIKYYEAYHSWNDYAPHWKIVGKISNNSSQTTYKDLKLEIEFFTQTKTPLSKESVVIYNIFQPNKQNEFTEFKVKLDLNVPKNVDLYNTMIKLVGAEVYEEMTNNE
jgi:hypothetical protein